MLPPRGSRCLSAPAAATARRAEVVRQQVLRHVQVDDVARLPVAAYGRLCVLQPCRIWALCVVPPLPATAQVRRAAEALRQAGEAGFAQLCGLAEVLPQLATGAWAQAEGRSAVGSALGAVGAGMCRWGAAHAHLAEWACLAQAPGVVRLEAASHLMRSIAQMGVVQDICDVAMRRLARWEQALAKLMPHAALIEASTQLRLQRGAIATTENVLAERCDALRARLAALP